MTLGLGLGGCIMAEEGGGGGSDTDGPIKASATATPTSAGDDSSSSEPDTSASDTSPSTTDPSSGSTTGDDTDGTGETMGIGDTGSTTDDSAGGTSTGDVTASTGESAISFAAIVQPILNANCGCHQGGGSSGMLVLDAGAAYDNLVDVESGQAAGVMRVAPADPANSYFLAKIQGTHADLGGSGNPMPPGGAINENQILLIEDWIADGALP